MGQIRHLAIFSDDPAKLAEFYVEVHGMTVTGRSDFDVWVTDGHVDVALIKRRSANDPRGIDHFGFTMTPDEKASVYEKLRRRGLNPFDPRADDPSLIRPYVEEAARDPDGNRFDMSTGKRTMEDEKRKQRTPG